MPSVFEAPYRIVGDWLWLDLEQDGRDYTVGVRTRKTARGRRAIRTVIVEAADGDRVDSAILNRLPIGAVETLTNNASFTEWLDQGYGPPGEAAANDLAPAIDRHVALQREAVIVVSEQREPLSRPDGSDPEAFYRQVAAAYSDVVTRTSAVAPVLAEEASVPVPTVHRWIREARTRGFLPPARRGRAG